MTKEAATTTFQVGDIVKSEAGFTGKIVAIEVDEINEPHVRASVRWDGKGKSYRPVDGLVKVEG